MASNSPYGPGLSRGSSQFDACDHCEDPWNCLGTHCRYTVPIQQSSRYVEKEEIR